MSDEFRDMLRGRANEVAVPPEDLGDVLRGGNARRWRNRAYSVSVIVLVAVVGWATVPDLLEEPRNREMGPVIANTPTPNETSTPVPAPGPCARVPFRPTYLPDGWSYEIQPGTGLQPGIPLDEQVPQGLGFYIPIDGEGQGTHVNVMELGSYYTLPEGAGNPIQVLGTEGRIGHVEDGNTVEFTYAGCEYSLMAFGIPKGELGRVARSLRPTGGCNGMPVGGRVMNLGNGRFFGYIHALNNRAVEYDVAEFLTGPEANEAAVAAGDIQAGEAVPNDYYIVNEDRATGRFPLADDVDVIIDTLQDGVPGAAPADLLWLMCEFATDEHELDTDVREKRPFWLTVRDGRVVEIEEQYLP
jgi:hypothetical protein